MLTDLNYHIEGIIEEISQCPGNGSPQVTRGVAMDVHKGILKIGRYLNPQFDGSFYEWKHANDIQKTLTKMVFLRMILPTFVNYLPDEPAIRAHGEVLQEHLTHSIRFLEKKMYQMVFSG